MALWLKSRILGRGSYGTVFLTVRVDPQNENEEVIAVKSSRPYLFESLQKEERILKLFISYKEILQCCGSQTTMENGYYIYNLFVEFAPYGSLMGVNSKKPLLESEVRIYIRMLLKGLSYLHGVGVVHCDLKPDNILLFPSSCFNYQLKIVDFGLAKTREENLDAEFWKLKFRETPYYMSPKSDIGQIEAPLDIWSLGCIVIEMIIGLLPWGKHLNKEQMMFKLVFLKESPEIPNGVRQDCRDLLNKCFVKDPTKRWTTCMLLDHPFAISISDMFCSSLFSHDCYSALLMI